MTPRKAIASPRKGSSDTRISMSLRLEPELYEELRRVAFEKRVTMLSLINEGIEAVLRRAKRRKGGPTSV